MQVKTSQAIRLITNCIKAQLVPMLKGSPGIGKSDIVHSIAKEYKLKVIDLRLSQCDPTDLLGFPNIKGNKAGYTPMETFPIEGDVIPEGYDGWLLFLDEFTSAPKAVQAAAYKIVLDRMVGVNRLHRNVAIVCAGNLETDNAIVEPMSTALQSRLVHMELVVDSKEWIEWAESNGINHWITSYIGFKPGNIYTFQPDHTDCTYACPRTYVFADRLLKQVDINDRDALPLLAGTLSEGIARELIAFCKLDADIPKISEIMSNPTGTRVPQEPSILFALTGSLSHHATMGNFESLMKYIKRIPAEFQVVCLKATIRRNKEMLAHKSLQEWISTSASTLF